MTRPLVEILYFDGCPNVDKARQLVQRVVDEGDVDADVRLVNVPDEMSAKRMRFLGSPSIRVDGRDIEPEAEARADHFLSCRIYHTAAGFSGEPDEAWLRDALAEARR